MLLQPGDAKLQIDAAVHQNRRFSNQALRTLPAGKEFGDDPGEAIAFKPGHHYATSVNVAGSASGKEERSSMIAFSIRNTTVGAI